LPWPVNLWSHGHARAHVTGYHGRYLKLADLKLMVVITAQAFELWSWSLQVVMGEYLQITLLRDVIVGASK